MLNGLILMLGLMTDPPKVEASPRVTDAEQIEVLLIQRNELAAEVAFLKAKLARIDKVNEKAEAWNARGCIVVSKPDGTLDCRPGGPEVKKVEKVESKPEKK